MMFTGLRKETNSNLKTRGIVVHSLHKSASMFLYTLFKDVSKRQELPFFSVNNGPANRGDIDSDIQRSFCICPERKFNFEEHNYPYIAEIIHIVQIRDPRDILVSEYYSNAWIHPDNAWSERRKELRKVIQTMSIDDYVLEGAEKLGTFGNLPLVIRYQPILNLSLPSQHQLIIVRYEDMIKDFKTWLTKVMQPFELNDILVTEYYEKYQHEFQPKEESLHHKRKMTPGDHREKLRPETIEKLNTIFQDILTQFYPEQSNQTLV